MITLVLPAVLFGGLMLGGCSHSASNTTAVPAPAQPGAPTNAQLSAQRAQVEQRMSQTREAAVSAWRQSHPGQKLPPGF